MQQSKKYIQLLFMAIAAVLVFSQCASSHKIPAGKQLLVKNKISIDNKKQISKDDLAELVYQKPNRKTLGMRLGMRMYLKTEHSQKRIPSWLRETFGEAPVYYDSLVMEASKEQFNFFLNEQGYYAAQIQSHLHERGRRNNKVKVHYEIAIGNKYTVTSVNYAIADSNMLAVVQRRRGNSVAGLTTPMPFEVALLKNEQRRISYMLNAAGYYDFSADKVFYSVDTSRGYNDVHLEINIKPNEANEQGKYYTYKIGNVFIYPDFKSSIMQKEAEHYDTLQLRDSLYYLSRNPRFLRPEVIDRINNIQSGSLYNNFTVERVQRQLSQVKLFRQSSIVFVETQKPDSTQQGEIDCNIQITPVEKQSMGLELEGITSGGDWGAEFTLNYEHRNIFRGAEKLSLGTHVMLGHNRALRGEDGKRFALNTYELGFEAELEIPNFVSPIKPERLAGRYMPSTIVRTAYNISHTADYIHPTFQISFGYRWSTNRNVLQSLNPIDVSYINYRNESQRFLDFLNNKVYYKYSFEDYLIGGLNYSYIFNNKPIYGNSLRNYNYFKFYIETAGNLLRGVYKLTERPTNEDGKYELFNTNFAQFIKVELDYRYNQIVSKKVSNVYRIYAGIGIPYGNSEALPSVKKFYSGGASSMRAWATRTLGPGAYNDTTQALKYYLGDVKFEANFETRFPLFWVINGAFFIDAGNVWNWNNSSMPHGEFFIKSFYKQIAIGSGVGLRLDFSFLVLRFDLGLKVKEAFTIANSNSSFIWGNRPLTSDDWNLTFAIGLPF